MRDTLGAGRALLIAPRWWVRREYLVLVKDLRREEPLPALDAPGLAVEWATVSPGDTPRLLAMNPRLSDADVTRRWRQGEECLAGLIDGRLAHYRWDTSAPAYLPYLHKTFTPHEGDVLTTEAFTHPAYRGRGLHSLSSAVAFARARERGLTRYVTMVAWWNRPAMRVVRDKARREVAGTVGYWRLGIATRHFATGSVVFRGAGGVTIGP